MVYKSLEFNQTMHSLVSSKPKQIGNERTIKLLVHDPTISRVIRLLETTNGVDKLIRTVQFVSRFVAFYSSSKAPSPARSTAQPRGLAAIRKHFGLSRKLLRFGNSIASLRALMQAVTDSSQADFVDRWTAIAQHAGFAAFSTVDSATYLPDAGICTVPHLKLLEKLAFIFWLWALVASILGGLYRLLRIRAKVMDLIMRSKSNATEVTEEEKEKNEKAAVSLRGTSKEVQLQILGAACDALFPAFALNFPVFRDINDGMLGLAGSISSFVGLRSAWRNTKA